MSERERCLCEWRGDFIVRFAEGCPRLEDHKDRLWPERKLEAIRRRALAAEDSELRGFILGITTRHS